MENKIRKVVCELSFDSNYNPFINFSYESDDQVVNMHSSSNEISNLSDDAIDVSDDVLYVNCNVKPIICDKNSGNIIPLTYENEFRLNKDADFFRRRKSIIFGYSSIKRYGFKSNLDVFYECMMTIIETASYYELHDILFEFVFNGKKIGDSSMPLDEVLEKLSECFYSYKRAIKKQTPTMLYTDEELERKGFKLD